MVNLNRAASKRRSALPAAAENLAKLWLYRAMVRLDAKSRMIGLLGREDPGLVSYLGIGGCVNDRKEPVDVLFDPALQEQLDRFEHKRMRKVLPAALQANVERLGKELRLSSTARCLLCFTLMMQNVRMISKGMDMLGSLTTSDLYHALAVILALPKASIRRELSHASPLIASGLVTIKRRGHANLTEKLNTLPGDFAAVARRHTFSPVTSPEQFIDALIAEARLKKDGRAQSIGFVANA